MTPFLNGTLYTILPGVCLLCDAKTNRHLDLCIDCENDLPWLEDVCSICSHPVPRGESICGKCLLNKPTYSRCHSAFVYQYPVDRLILNFKRQQNLIAGHLLANLLGSSLSSCHSPPDLLIPMPLHKRAQKARGFNQSAELAKVLSDKLKTPLELKQCRRIIDTREQKSLSVSDRVRNVKGAFSLRSGFSGEKVGIVDDVVTTGATINELARVILANGAGSVEVYCLARTPL